MSKYIDYDAIDYRNDRLHDKSEEFLNGVMYIAQRIGEAATIEVSEDCISREWVLQMLTTYEKDRSSANELDEWQNRVVEWIEMDIEDAPSVVPSREEGEWVEVVKRTEQYDKEGRKSWAVIYQCPNCGFVLNAIENHITQYNYCPNCGAKMKGVDDEGTDL